MIIALAAARLMAEYSIPRHRLPQDRHPCTGNRPGIPNAGGLGVKYDLINGLPPECKPPAKRKRSGNIRRIILADRIPELIIGITNISFLGSGCFSKTAVNQNSEPFPTSLITPIRPSIFSTSSARFFVLSSSNWLCFCSVIFYKFTTVPTGGTAFILKQTTA